MCQFFYNISSWCVPSQYFFLVCCVFGVSFHNMPFESVEYIGNIEYADNIEYMLVNSEHDIKKGRD